LWTGPLRHHNLDKPSAPRDTFSLVPITPHTRLSRSADVLYAQVGSGEAVAMSVEQGAYYGLNPVGARICELLETPRTVGELTAQLCDEFEVDAAAAQAEVMTFVATLLASGIVREEP
jgi:hypothetical protein